VYAYVKIDPGNAFKIVVKCEKFKAILEYAAVLDMDEQWHDLWIDRCSGHNIDAFVTNMASKIPWGPSQTLDVWAVDVGCDSSWKIRKIEHFEKMMKSMFLDRLANLVVEVVEKRYQEFVDEEVVEEVVLWTVLVSLAKHKQQLMQA
jgi:hypothetical protein